MQDKELMEYIVAYVGDEYYLDDLLKEYGCELFEYGYRVRIGDNRIMFTSHLDDVYTKKNKTKLIWDGRFLSNKKGIIGGDDKCGVYVMLNMISAKVPGDYIFFFGEESGCLGSNMLYPQIGNEFDKCISFDRKGYSDIIHTQKGERCCSDDFVYALSDAFAEEGLYLSGAYGIYTDSATFIDKIPECTNLSVGYFNNHTPSEYIDWLYLKHFTKACINIDWESLPVVRKPYITRRKYIYNDIQCLYCQNMYDCDDIACNIRRYY